MWQFIATCQRDFIQRFRRPISRGLWKFSNKQYSVVQLGRTTQYSINISKRKLESIKPYFQKQINIVLWLLVNPLQNLWFVMPASLKKISYVKRDTIFLWVPTYIVCKQIRNYSYLISACIHVFRNNRNYVCTFVYYIFSKFYSIFD